MELTFSQVGTEREIAEVAKLAADIWREYYVSLITREQVDYMVDKYQSVPAITEQIEQQGCEYYLMRAEEVPVGYMAVKEEEGRLFLSKFYVHKEYRGRGYASRADAFLEELCLRRDLSRIWLTVNRDNASSIAVYEKKGFRVVREQVADIGGGFVMDDFVMEKEIAHRP
ncbi:GNAT family N-acetyltransferase [Saccharibacillus alkalitolerans]|uniref:GNAT family N-acetyltransferase n=1 Tax=Saccharibacillus alkalitolerans TaxID=2705290 RepID=A0ABX0F946_9BACL|nr:GNAT family N-acetyltransferase [Saccharibacillus alkalitolerans]NGZ77468.1 GNAT family N-acetyltransferase [Saccharibacillus alkalitolerans]